MDINTAIQPLRNYLSNTREFIELKNAKLIIKQNPQSNALLENFKARQESLYQKQLSQLELQKIMEELEKEYKQLLTIPQVERYFKAIDNFNVLMSNVIKEISTSLESNLN